MYHSTLDWRVIQKKYRAGGNPYGDTKLSEGTFLGAVALVLTEVALHLLDVGLGEELEKGAEALRLEGVGEALVVLALRRWADLLGVGQVP